MKCPKPCRVQGGDDILNCTLKFVEDFGDPADFLRQTQEVQMLLGFL